MQSIAGFLVLIGAGSFLLNMIGMEFVLLSWIDTWGPGVGTAIRIGMIVVGAGLFIVGAAAESGGGGDDDLDRDAARYL